MKPRRPGNEELQGDLFRTELERIVDKDQPLVELSNRLDWKGFEEKFGKHYEASKGRAGVPTQLMVGLHYLKYTYNLSDE